MIDETNNMAPMADFPISGEAAKPLKQTQGGPITTTGPIDMDEPAKATTSAAAKVRDEAVRLTGEATGKAKDYAAQGKDRATGALDDVAQMMTEAAGQVDDRLGEQYGRYARIAADAVAGLASTLREKDVDELVGDARELVRKSPAVAIGAAAAIGFVLARLVKAGAELPEATPATPSDTIV